MKTWTPLFNTIVDSSVWGESKDVKILWITMLAKKDSNGFVEGSLPGLARAAVLTPSECEKAMKVLESPDRYSTSPENDGRRVSKVDGGWMVLNHAKYRDEIERIRLERRREYNRRKQAEYRAKSKGSALMKTQSDIVKEAAEKNGDNYTTERLDEMRDGVAPGTYLSQHIGGPNT